MSRRCNQATSEPVAAKIQSLSDEGHGIAHINDKTVLVDNALTGEDVRLQYRKRRGKYLLAQAVQINTPSPQRIDPKCEAFGICGGCSLQHIQQQWQIEHKQSVLIEQLRQIGNVTPQSIIPPLTGPQWGYRHKARLAVKYVTKKSKVLVGFREKYSSYIADLDRCEVLHPTVGLLLQPLQSLIAELSLLQQIPQIEVAIGEQITALVFRHLAEFSNQDIIKLKAFARQHALHIYLQSAGVDSVIPLEDKTDTSLSYTLPEFDLSLHFLPTDFTQVNMAINRAMVSRTLSLLQLNPSDRVLDLFCGIGNFTLPLSCRAASVLGIDVDRGLIERARQNAIRNQIHNVEFQSLDLSSDDLHKNFCNINFVQNGFNKLLLDPSRTGAHEVVTKLDLSTLESLIYVSCKPTTLARDAGILVHQQGFELAQAGIIDMFPHTRHIESMALFTRKA